MYLKNIFALIFLLILELLVNLSIMQAEEPTFDVCELPKGCHISPFRVINKWWAGELVTGTTKTGIRCHVDEGSLTHLARFNRSLISSCENPKKIEFYVELKPLNHARETFTKSQNLTSFMTFLAFFNSSYFTLKWTNMHGFELDLFGREIIYDDGESYLLKLDSKYVDAVIENVEFVNAKMTFYIGKRKVKSCKDIIDANITDPRSIFQMSLDYVFSTVLFFRSVYKEPICPLVFKYVSIQKLVLYGMSNTFFKQNYLRFINYTTENLYTYFYEVSVYYSGSIPLNSQVFNPAVFKRLQKISMYSGLSQVDGDFLTELKKLNILQIEANIMRALMHKGTDWIKSLNLYVNVSMNDDVDMGDSFYFQIRVFDYHKTSELFPDEDFCLYKDFPFSQLVILFIRFEGYDDWLPRSYKIDFSCTYLYLIQYYPYLKEFINNSTYAWFILDFNVNSNSSRPVCDFEAMRDKCTKTEFQEAPVWDSAEIAKINNSIGSVLNILVYIVSAFGIITNTISIVVILSKKNSELFKDFKQYDYLCLGSVFNIMIFSIQIFSIFSDCSIYVDLICLETRKYAGVQFFKLIFKEGFLVALKFMCNFAYAAFSLNRISLIGNDHSKLVVLVSKTRIAVYLLLTGLISISLSVVKAFKYKINYGKAEYNYPILFEIDLWAQLSWKNDAYMLATLISDFLNYIVFVFINLAVDVLMVVKLKRTLREKLLKFRSVSDIVNEKTGKDIKKVNKKQEYEDVVNKAIKMVVVTNLLSILFKFPMCINPVLNAIAEYYYKDANLMSQHPGFRIFYENYSRSEFASLVQDAAHFLYYLSLSIQLFMFAVFDKKFKTGYDRLKKSLLPKLFQDESQINALI